MIETFRKIWKFAGKERANINKSVAVSFLNAVFRMFEVSAIYFVIAALTEGQRGAKAAWIALGFMLVSIIGNGITASISKMQQTHAGYFMAANERIKIGNLLKGVPMGFFNDNSLGEVTGVCTTVLGNVETLVPMTLVNIMGGVIGTIVFTAMMLFFEWRVGLIAAAGLSVLSLVLLHKDAFAASGKITDLISIRSIVLLAVLYYFTAVCKKTKGLHPVAFIAASAVIGVVLRFGGV